MCKYRPRFFVGYKSLATCKRSERQRDREMTGQTENTFYRTITPTPRSKKTGGETEETELLLKRLFLWKP